MGNKFILLTILGLTLMAQTACSKRPSGFKAARWKTVYVGDPMNLVKDATRYDQLTVSDLADLPSAIHAASAFEFRGQQKIAVRNTPFTQEELETENAPTVEPESTGYSLCQVKNGARAIEITWDCQRALGFSFRWTHNADLKKNRQIQISKNAFRTSNTAQLIHFSRNKNMMSFLILDNPHTPSARLLAIYFMLQYTPPNEQAKTQGGYNYLDGTDIKISWPRHSTVHVDFCGPDALSMVPLAKSGVRKWQKALGQRLDLKFRHQIQFAPFTDLHQHCFYVIDDFSENAYLEKINPAMTYTIVDYNERPTIVDSDILIFKKEILKMAADSDDMENLIFEIDHLLAHELGHFLGLDHQFDDAIKSIMSYDWSEYQLTPYDKEAIQALYD